MMSTLAWKRHGCYTLGSQQYFNMPLEKALLGCHDDWNALDHFDPTADNRRLFAQFFHLRSVYAALQDGFNLVQRGNWTYLIDRPGSNDTATEMGLWSVSRSAIPTFQTLKGNFVDQIWLLYSNENTTKTYTFDCQGSHWISSPYQSNVQLRNLFAPYENYTLEASLSSYYNNGTAPFFGCLPSVAMDSYGFKALVPIDQWTPPLPALTKFVPGHDHRILVNPNDANATTVNISFEFNTQMNCDSVSKSIHLNMSSSGHGGSPNITNIQCGDVQNPSPSKISGGGVSVWAWSATLTNFPDGVLTLTLNNPSAQNVNMTTGVRLLRYYMESQCSSIYFYCQAVDNLLLRKGASDNVMVFPDSDYDTKNSFAVSNEQYTFAHRAYGADMLRYSWNFGQNWTTWRNWEDTTVMNASLFTSSANFWPGNHVMVQCECCNASLPFHV